MKARWVELIEKVQFTLSIASQNSKANKTYKDNRQISGGQNPSVTAAAQLSSNTAHNSGYQKSATQSNQKASDTVYSRPQPKSSQAGGARVSTIQQQKNIKFEASVRSG